VDNLDVFFDNLLGWLARTIRSNVLFGAVVVATVGTIIAAAWFVFTR
jgi:hypothetical protein